MKRFFFLLLMSMCFVGVGFAQVPRFENNFAGSLKQGSESVFDLGIDPTKTLQDNVKELFNPLTGGRLWNFARVIGLGIFILMFIIAGAKFITGADDEGAVKTARMNLLYMLYGGFLFYGVTRLLGSALQIHNPGGTEELINRVTSEVFFQVIAMLKAGIFFTAIILVVYYGYKVMRAMDDEEKFSQGKNGVINVVVALALTKVIDYIYYIARTPASFLGNATGLIVQISRLAAYFVGIAFLGSAIYAGFLLVTGADEDAVGKAKDILTTIFLVSVVLFIFLLIIYQIFNQFA